MKNKILNQLYSSCKKWKTLVLIGMLLTLGVGQMWAKVVYYNDQGANGTPRVYYWNGSPATTWDGCPSMVQISGNIYGYDIGTNTKCIFRYNNASSQTSDLSVPNDSKNYISTKTGTTWSTLSTYTASSTLYLLVNANWKQDGARFAACFLGVAGQAWVNCTQVGTSDYYSVTVPSTNEYPYVIFCRMNGGNNTNSWSNVWNQTDDLAPSSGKNGVEITGWSNSQSWIVVYTGLSVTHTPTTAANAPTISQTLIKSGSYVNVSAANANTGYHFVNWTSSNGSFGTASNQNTTFTPSAQNATATANYAEDTYTVTVSNDGNGSTTPTGAQSNVGRFSGLPIDATANTNYEFVNWTITSGTGSFESDATSKSNRFYPTGAATIRANFRSTLTYSLTVNAGTGISSVTGSTDPVTLGNSYAISATPTSGYTFSTWTADPAANGTFANANTASTNVTVKNGSVTVTGAATENMTTVTVNVNPASAGTLTVGGSAFTPGSTTTAGVATSRTVVATPASGKVFLDWSVSGNATGSASTNTYTLKGNGSSGTGTLTANFGILSGWNMEGEDFGGWSRPSTYKFAYPYRGMSGVYYIPTTLNKDKWWKVNNGSTPFNATNASTTVSKGTIYNLVEEWTNSSKVSTTLSNVWVVINTNDTKKIWVQDPQTFHNVNVTNEGSGSKGTYKVTLNSTSAFTKGDNVFETTQFANGEGVKITVIGVDGYIPTITIGANVFTFWKQATSYEATFTMGSDDVNVTISYTAAYAVTFATTTGCAMLSALGPASATVTTGDKVKSGTSITFNQTATSGYEFSKWYSTNTGTGGTQWGTESSLTKSITSATSVYPIYNALSYTVILDKQTSAPGYSAPGTIGDQTVTYNATLPSIEGTIPTAADGYAFMGFFTEPLGAGLKVINPDKSWETAVEDLISASKWIKKGGVTLYAYYKKAEITGLTLSQAIVAPNTKGITVTPTIEPTPTGTVAVCYEIQYSNGTALSPQPTMSTSASNVLTFTAPAASATYRVHASLCLTDCNGTELDETYTTFQVAGDHTVTIQYKCDDAVIKASTTVTGKPLAWSDEAIEAPTITGYTFARWEAGEGVSLTDDDGTTTKTTTTSSSIKIKATYDGMLTAVYTQKNMIYFYNTLGWEDVYVYFYENGNYWNDTYGTGANQWQNWGGQNPYYFGEHGEMTQIAGTDIWYFDYTEAGYPTRANVVFANQDQSKQTDCQGDNACIFFSNNAKVCRRGDHDYRMPMFVPLAGQTGIKRNENRAEYFSDGYWMNYPLNTGYTLKIYANSGDATPTHTIRFPFSSDKKMPLKLAVEFDQERLYYYTIYREDGNVLSADYGMNTNYHSNVRLNDSSKKISIKTTAAGIYTFTLVYKNTPAVDYYISVDYPVGKNDYRIWYSDNATWSKGAHVKNTWYHPSDVIRKNSNAEVTQYDTVSFFISNANSPAMKFQYAKAIAESGVITWNDVTSGSIDLNNYSSAITKAGVYNFIVKQVGTANPTIEKVEPYTGDYYIRTDCAGDTKWDSYKATDHQMTYSDYAKDYSYTDASKRYTHYYAHWVTSGTNVKFCIANDYSQSISDTIAEDYGTTIANITSGGTLESGNANIRFMWNQSTNKINRAYISGSGGITDRFLVLEGDARMYDEGGHALTGTYQDHDQYGNYLGTDNQVILHDDENFVYERTIKVNATARAKLTAKYNENIQYFKGSAGEFADGTTVQLLGGTYAADKKYLMRIIYDFKTNRLVSAYMPEGEVSDPLAINADLMLIREHQEDAQQLIFTDDGALTSVKSVYGVMRFNRWTLNNREKTGEHPLVSDPKSPYERSLYWISFPFDVNLSDVFGFGTYGVDWIIEYYDGVSRAQNGYWKDSPSFWKYVMPAERATYKLEKGKGYVLALDIDRMKSDNTDFWKNNIEQIELFFPSASTNVGSITATNVTTTVESHECTIDRTNPKGGADIDKNRTKADSHWNMIGVPSYANYGSTLTSDGSTGITWQVQWSADPYVYNLPYLYEWNTVDNTYTVQSGSTYPFKSMHSYMVQYAGDLYWSLASATPSSIVARRTYAEEPKEVEFRLELLQNDKAVDQTFVKLSEKEEVSAGFSFDEDLCKEYNDSKANIYTFIENWIPAAGNILPMGNQTTLVPVGVKAIAEDEYTFSMPDGTDGVGVTLVDTETGERTNLALSDYKVSLAGGTYDGRFVLEISPIEQIVTGIEMINGENGDASLNGEKVTGVCKKLIDGVLYIVKDGKVFDARGARIQ